MLWPTLKIALVALLIVASAVISNNVRYRRDKKRFLRTITEQGKELQRTKVQLDETKHLLVSAEKKLGFLNNHKTPVQVTAFTGQGSFANGTKTELAYAAPTHILPPDNILSIALSPLARRNLHARLNDYIVLLDRTGQISRLARFVDTTAADEIRPVVDVFFARDEEARIFGRQQHLAVNISAADSPFREN